MRFIARAMSLPMMAPAQRHGELWKNAGVDPTITARALWLVTHPLPLNPGTEEVDTEGARRQ
jgi:hypothetical protein